MALAYGLVQDAAGYPSRWTFIIGPDGKILHIDKNVNVKTHGADCAAELEELGVAKAEEEPEDSEEDGS